MIYDLYSGTGTITQLMSKVAKQAIGVEIVEEAVEAAKENAKENKVENCIFYAGDVLKGAGGRGRERLSFPIRTLLLWILQETECIRRPWKKSFPTE